MLVDLNNIFVEEFRESVDLVHIGLLIGLEQLVRDGDDLRYKYLIWILAPRNCVDARIAALADLLLHGESLLL